MASNTICTPCLRALRTHLRRSRTQQRALALTQRTLTTTSFLHQQHPVQQQAPQSSKTPPPPPPKDAFQNLASSLRSQARTTTEPYIAYGSTEDLYLLCSAPVAYTIPSRHFEPPEPAPTNDRGEDVGVANDTKATWFRPKEQGGLGLDVTFINWSQVTMLHMYILTVRLRTFPAEHARIWHQQLLDHFFYAAEDRMATEHNISARSVRNKYLKDMWQQWRGVLLSYDEGLVKGDAVMAGAVWRNLFRGDERTDVEDIARVVAFIRKELRSVDKLSDEKLASAEVRFGELGAGERALERRNQSMEQPLGEEDVKATTTT